MVHSSLQCNNCWKEARYNCCWNANYCNELCQQAHWHEHMNVCNQVQQQPSVVPRTPAILSPTVQSTNAFMFTNPGNGTSSSSSSSTSSSSSVSVASTAGMGSSAVPHREMDMDESQLRPVNSAAVHQQNVSPLPPNPMELSLGMPYHPVQATVTPVAEPMANYEGSMTTIEHIPNRNILLNHSTPSPCSPQHFHSVLMDQTSCKNPTLPALNLPPSSPNSNSSSLTGVPLHTQPISPASPSHSENPSSMGNPSGFSWPYQQAVGPIPDFPQTLPYLPQVPAATPTTQNVSFFRVF